MSKNLPLLTAAQVEALPDVISPSEIALLLLCSPRTVYRLHHAGKMPAPVGAGRLLWRKTDILELLATQRGGVA